MDLLEARHSALPTDRPTFDKAVEVFKKNNPELAEAVQKLMGSDEVDPKRLSFYELQVFAALVFFGYIEAF